MERVYAFLPSIVFVAGIGAVAHLLLWRIYVHYRNEASSSAREPIEEEVKRAFAGACGTVLMCCMELPAVAVLIQAPAVLLFPKISLGAWNALFLLSSLALYTCSYLAANPLGNMLNVIFGFSGSEPFALSEQKSVAGRMNSTIVAIAAMCVLFLLLYVGYSGVRHQSILLMAGAYSTLSTIFWLSVLVITWYTQRRN